MITITEVEELKQALNKYIGWAAEIWMFSVSLRRLVIRLSMRDTSEVVYVIAASCQYIKGPFYWENSNLKIRKSINVETSKEIYTFYDDNTNFELICMGGIGFVIGQEDELTSVFDNFNFTN